MSGSTVRCPEGHENPADQPYCGACGTSLVGLCPNGHANPTGQRFCGDCGAAFSEQQGAHAQAVLAPQVVTPIEETSSTEPSPLAETASDVSLVRPGATFTTAKGEEAVVRKITGDDVWIDVKDTAGSDVGTFRFPIAEVKTTLTQQAMGQPAEFRKPAAMDEQQPAQSARPSAPASSPVSKPTTAPQALPAASTPTPGLAEVTADLEARAKSWWTRVMSWWKGLTNRWRIGVIAGGVGLLVVVLFASGACENSQYRRCVKEGMRTLEYYQGTSENRDALKRACARLYGKY